MFKRLALILAALAFAAVVSGCAHPISLSPDLAKVTNPSATRVDKKVGFYIAEANRQLEVTTPGGGGDKVRYFPYRDLETGVYKAMSEVFADVTRVSGPTDPKVRAGGLAFVLSPTLRTTSYSPSLVTWPPTEVGIEMTCTVTDAQGQPLTQVTAKGVGRAEFDDFKVDHSLAGKRAADDVLKNLVQALSQAAALTR